MMPKPYLKGVSPVSNGQTDHLWLAGGSTRCPPMEMEDSKKQLTENHCVPQSTSTKGEYCKICLSLF